MAHILVVDDDRDLRGLVDFRLRKAGHQVVAAGDGAGDRPLGRLRPAEEALEQACLLVLGDPDAGVAHGQHDAVLAVALELDGDLAAGRRELQRVGDEMVEQLMPAVAVGEQRRHRRERGAHRDLAELRLRAGMVDRRLDELVETRPERAAGRSGRLDLGDEQHVAEQLLQAIGVAVDDVDEVAQVGRQIGLLAQQLDVAHDRRQRRAQLV